MPKKKNYPFYLYRNQITQNNPRNSSCKILFIISKSLSYLIDALEIANRCSLQFAEEPAITEYSLGGFSKICSIGLPYIASTEQIGYCLLNI